MPFSLSTLFPELADPRKGVHPVRSSPPRSLSGVRLRAGATSNGIHFIGVGGIGMSALARWFLSQSDNPGRRRGAAQNRPQKGGPKRPISGSDLVRSKITRKLQEEGLEVKIGHKKGHINGRIGLVIHSLAAKTGNPELGAARALKIPILSYPEAVGRLTRAYKTIAVAGAHGKSTTTALVALLLQKTGLDPTVIVGTNLREFGGRNFRSGGGKWLVLEADEFGKSFLHHSPTLAVVTNIDLEHLDTYRNLTDVKNNFFKFLSNTERGGTLILNRDSKNLCSLAPRIKKLAKGRNYGILWYSIRGNTAKKIKKIIKIPGEHNVSNALAAYFVGRILKIPERKILSAIGLYRGSWRRMEYRGKFQIPRLCRPALRRWLRQGENFGGQANSKLQIPVFDDYAHHPAEIRATLKAFREKYPRPKGRGSLSAARFPVVCIYQPHQALRLKKLWKDFINAFADADILILIPMYRVAGRDRTDPRFTSQTLATAIQRKYPKRQVFYLANPAKIKFFLSKLLNAKFHILNSGIVVMMGAGNIVNYTPLLLNRK